MYSDRYQAENMSDFEFDFLIMQMKCKTKPATALNFMPFKLLVGKL